MKRNSKYWFSLLGIVLALGFASQGLTQETKPETTNNAKTGKGTKKAAAAKPTPDLSEWKSLLDHVAIEAKTVDGEEDRPLLIAEVGDAYWRFDTKQSKTLFTDAFERALSTPRSQGSIRKILALVAKRDRALAVSLTKRLNESRDPENELSDPSGEVFRTARELLDSDRELAIELAQTAAASGPSMGGLFFLFKLAEKDPAAADQLYTVYLTQLIARGNPPLSSVLWLAGYPFGYGEAYGGSNNPEDFGGFGALRVEKLRPNPKLARAYLQLAFASVTDTLRQAAAIPDRNTRDELNGMAMFTTQYLFPEIRNYLPAAEGAWSGLYRQALTVTSEPRKALIEAHLQYFSEVRSRTTKYKSTDDYLAGDASDKSELINKLPDGCKRDQARAELALNIGHIKKFAEARQVADQIDNTSLRENVVQFLNYDVAVAALEAGNLLEASTLAEKVAAKNERALLLVKIANQFLSKGDKAAALDLLNRTRSLVTQSDDPELQSDALVAIANVYVHFDPLEAVMVLRDAIKAFNRVKDQNTEAFAVLRRVDMTCGRQPQWHGSKETADTSDLYETFAAIANSEVQAQEALLIASELENKATRLRAQLSIVKAVFKDQ